MKWCSNTRSSKVIDSQMLLFVKSLKQNTCLHLRLKCLPRMACNILYIFFNFYFFKIYFLYSKFY